ncbi:MFS transporter [Halorubellus sp. JP-L1]|nr:MFS transporter [Halorubellus sp. JP-L1]
MRLESDRLQFPVLYLTRFATGFGFATLAVLLATYVNQYDPSGLMLGLFTSGFAIAQTVAVVPIAYLGDARDKRNVLVGVLALGVLAYVGFAALDVFSGGEWAFVGVRALQGAAVTGSGLLSLALVGDRSPPEDTAQFIGKANAWRLLAGILGGGVSGVLYDVYGFGVVYSVIVGLLSLAMAGVVLVLAPDTTRVEGFPFRDLAVNARILTLSAFRAPYAVAVTLVRTWVLLYAGVEAVQGGLGFAAVAVSVVYGAERFTNMLCQPYTGRLSDRFGRATFVAAGGGAYGLVALAVPLAPTIGAEVALPSLPALAGAVASLPGVTLVLDANATAGVVDGLLGTPGESFLVLVALNGLLGVADSFREPASMALFADEGSDGDGVASSFGIRELVWRPGSVLAPMVGGVLTTSVGYAAVFYVGGASALVGVALFLGALWYTQGAEALTTW